MDKKNLARVLALPHELRGIAAEAILGGARITNLRAYCAAIAAREDRPSGFDSFDGNAEEDGIALSERIAAPEVDEIERWRRAELREEVEAFLDTLRVAGTAGIAARLGVTQRRAQQMIAAMAGGVGAGAAQRDLFATSAGGAA